MKIVITGASGFLGHALVSAAGEEAIVIPSPRCGGPDLAALDAPEQLDAFVGDAAADAVLIHAAAMVDLRSHEAMLANAALGMNVARWATRASVHRAVLVSSVSVLPFIDGTDAGGQPRSYYGLGKRTAEDAWALEFPPDRMAIVRLAGVLGWQARPSLFWNRVLLAAASPAEPLLLKRRQSARNYIAVDEAARVLLRIARAGVSGTFTLAGLETWDLARFATAVQALPGSRLAVQWADDGDTDRSVFEASRSLLGWLQPFDVALRALWDNRPAPADY